MLMVVERCCLELSSGFLANKEILPAAMRSRYLIVICTEYLLVIWLLGKFKLCICGCCYFN